MYSHLLERKNPFSYSYLLSIMIRDLTNDLFSISKLAGVFRYGIPAMLNNPISDLLINERIQSLLNVYKHRRKIKM